MFSSNQGTIRLFRFSGIDVFLHWSWFFIAIFEINGRKGQYSSFIWNVLEYLALFLIVMLHEFGHSLACRQVGGTANRIVLWPLGGVAYVDPPPRPGATLWSIAAGPLVNVVLAPLLYGLGFLGKSMGWWLLFPNAHALLRAVYVIDLVLLGFNLLPIYPLDGGQMFRSVLWFVLGRARSLMVATVLGLVGVVGFVVLAFYLQSVWLGIRRRVYAPELLERIAASARITEDGEIAEAARVLLSALPASAAGGRVLEVRQVRTGVRYVRDQCYVSVLFDPVFFDAVPGLRRSQRDERVDGASVRGTALSLGYCADAKRYSGFSSQRYDFV